MVTGAVLLMLATVVGGAPSITFPINSQVPPVARVAKPFNFVFSSFTFTSTTASMDYTLRASPKWLQLDSASRTLSGTPEPGDEGAVVVTLTATDSTGSTDLASTLIVSAAPAPSLGSSVAEQLPSFGTTLNSTTLALYPSAPFSFGFKSDTFLNTNGDTVFYAVSAGNSPLPSWIHFNSASLTFSGTTQPSSSPSAPPDYFGIQLTASDVVGFAGATTAFTIVVGLHELLFIKSQQTINFTEGRNLDFTDLRSQLQLDGKTISDQDLRQATADVPAWLKFDNETLGISGTPPQKTTSLTISVEVVDVYGDIANTTVLLQSTSTLFSGKFGNLNATMGHDFSYVINQSLLTDRDVQISVDLGKTSSWLRYDPQTLTIHGHVPKDITPQDFELNVTASKGATTDSQTILLTVRSSEVPVTPHASSSLSSTIDATSSPSSTSASAPRSTALGLSNDGSLSKGAIAAAVLLPCLTIIGAILLSFYFLRRRRRVAGVKKSTNRPLLAQDNPEPDPEMAELRGNQHARVPSVPRINWKPSTSRRSSHIRLPGESIDEESEIHELSAPKDSVIDRHSKYLKDTEINPHRPESRAEFAIAHDESATTRRNTLHNPRKRPTSRHLSAALTDMSQSRRNSRRTNRDSAMTFKSTSQKRMSGLGHGKSASRPTSRGSLAMRTSVGGHGKGDFGPANHGLVRRSIWSPRSTWTASESGSSNYQESESTMHQTDSFPQPPRPGTTARPGIRTVTEQDQTPTRSRSQKRLSACTARQSYLDNRARARHSTNPFLSAGSSSTRTLSHRTRHPLPPASLGATTTTSRSASFHPSEHTIRHSTTISREATHRTQRSYSKSSSLDAPLRPPSRKMSSPSPRKSIGARVAARLGQSRSPVRRGQSPSKASVTGSSRFESAASSRLDLGSGGGEDGEAGQWVGKSQGKGKAKDREKEEWRHAGHLNPLAANTANPGDGEISERVAVASVSDAPGPARTKRTADGEERLLRLSLFFAPPGESAADDPVMRNFRRTLQRAWGVEGDDVGNGDGDGDGGVFGEGEVDGEGRARFVEENKGKRPTSVEVAVGGQSRNKSLRGNLGNVGNMGQVGDGRDEGDERDGGDEGNEGNEWSEAHEGHEGDERIRAFL